jgi:hypothetical protein
VQFREFRWTPGRLDGDMDDDDVRMAPRFCRPSDGSVHRPHVDDDADRDRSRPRRRELLGSFSRWFDQRRGRAPGPGRDHRGGWFRGESSRYRRMPGRSLSPPPCRSDFTPEEERALRGLWSDFEEYMDTSADREVAQKNSMHKTSLAIVIEPTVVFGSVEPLPSLSSVTNCGDAEFAQQQVSLSNAIVIVPQEDQSLGNRPGPDNASHNVPAKITQPETEPVESCQKPAESVGGRTLASSSPRVCDEVVLPTQEIPGAFVLQSDKSMENPYASISPH